MRGHEARCEHVLYKLMFERRIYEPHRSTFSSRITYSIPAMVSNIMCSSCEPSSRLHLIYSVSSRTRFRHSTAVVGPRRHTLRHMRRAKCCRLRHSRILCIQIVGWQRSYVFGTPRPAWLRSIGRPNSQHYICNQMHRTSLLAVPASCFPVPLRP